MPDSGLFPALLKHWRGQRGLSQLDLALSAGVSSRHVSFLETGRSSPSAEMVLRLGTTLGVPLRHVNAMLRAAGHDPVYAEDSGGLPEPVRRAVELLKEHQEPYPLVLIDRAYQVLDVNRGALRLFGALLDLPVPPEGLPPEAVASLGLNLGRMCFDPASAQPYLANFDEVGRQFLWRLQREVLADPDDGALRALLDELLALPTVDPGWREVDLSVPSDPALAVHLRKGALDLRFFTLVTAFQAPQNVALEELRVETWFPYDAATAEACRRLVEAQPSG